MRWHKTVGSLLRLFRRLAAAISDVHSSITRPASLKPPLRRLLARWGLGTTPHATFRS